MRTLTTKTTKIWVVVIAGTATFAAGYVFAYEASRGPTELVYWDPHKAFSGYTFVKPQRVRGAYLVDMAGQVVNHWPELGDAYLLEDGTVFGSKGNATFALMDWNGNTLWEHREAREGYNPHHVMHSLTIALTT